MLFDTKLLGLAIEMHQNDLDEVKVAQNESTKIVCFKTKKIDSLILPLHNLNSEDLEKHGQLLENFKNELKGGK